jgi:hypothetical protein
MSNQVPVLVAVEMGYGHLRAAMPLADALGVGLVRADRPPIVDEKEAKTWRWFQRGHEVLSTPHPWAAVFGSRPLGMDWITHIPPLYSQKDLTAPDMGTHLLHQLAKRGLGRGLMRYLERNPGPLVTTYFAPAIVADYHGYDRIYCLVTDADMHRVWVPKDPGQSRITYFAPSTRVVRRLEAYGVARSKIVLTGFPLPSALTNGKVSLEEQMRERLVRLDPEGAFRELHSAELGRMLGGPLGHHVQGKPLRMTFAIGGAGAQAGVVEEFLDSLKERIWAGSLQVCLAAGIRQEVHARFQRALKRLRLEAYIGRGVRIVHASDFRAYYDLFNDALVDTDVLWTKPSELSFYAGLGIALVLSKPVGMHERYNRRWLRQQGVAFKQESSRHAAHWLDEWLVDGTLAGGAWAGYLRMPKDGTQRIVAAVMRENGASTKVAAPSPIATQA